MNNRPYRSNVTWLTDDDLILLDGVFDGGAMFHHLRRNSTYLRYHVGYEHELDDDLLRCRLVWLCEHCILATDRQDRYTYYCMTENGGKLWSQERCPVWERYCRDHYGATSRNRTMMSVVAVSQSIRDDFLRVCSMYPTRVRTATISNHCLIPWKSFPRFHVGVSTYVEENAWTPEEYVDFERRQNDHLAVIQRERSWWRSIRELQRFTPKAA